MNKSLKSKAGGCPDKGSCSPWITPARRPHPSAVPLHHSLSQVTQAQDAIQERINDRETTMSHAAHDAACA